MYGVQSVTHLALKALDPEQPKTSSSLSKDEKTERRRSALKGLINLQKVQLCFAGNRWSRNNTNPVQE